MMPHQRHTNATGDFPMEEMVGKPFQTGPAKTLAGGMKPSRMAGGQLQHPAKLIQELLPQPGRNWIIPAHGIGQVFGHAGVEFEAHARRAASKRRHNSASPMGCACPVSISRSRRSASANSASSDRSSDANGSESGRDWASDSRWPNGNCSAAFSSSATSVMLTNYAPGDTHSSPRTLQRRQPPSAADHPSLSSSKLQALNPEP